MNLDQCYNTQQFRRFARRRLPGPIFHYIDGAADDEVTYRRNTEAYEECDLVPSVLAGVENIDMSTEVMGKRVDLPLFLSPTALQRLFHHRAKQPSVLLPRNSTPGSEFHRSRRSVSRRLVR